MITQDKITDIFCTLDEFSKKFDAEVAKGFCLEEESITFFILCQIPALTKAPGQDQQYRLAFSPFLSVLFSTGNA